MMDNQWSADVHSHPAPLQSPLELPDGSYPTRLDDRGRLRLPTAFVRYFDRLAEKKLFVTSLDGRTLRIYPIAVWRQARQFLATHPDDPGAADLLFLANHYGANTEVDPQGRILIHEDLRRALSLENRPLMLMPWVWRVDVLPEDEYRKRLGEADQDRDEKLARLTAKGLL